MNKSQLKMVRERVIDALELIFGNCPGSCKEVRLLDNSKNQVQVVLSRRVASKLGIKSTLVGTLDEILETIKMAAKSGKLVDMRNIAVA